MLSLTNCCSFLSVVDILLWLLVPSAPAGGLLTSFSKGTVSPGDVLQRSVPKGSCCEHNPEIAGRMFWHHSVERPKEVGPADKTFH